MEPVDKFEPLRVQFMAMVNCSTGHINLTWDAIEKLFESSKNNDAAGDATWILTSAFIIFTMQSGFGLLEAGTVSSKNESNIMVKNAVDVIFGALGYWVCGFGFSFGDNPNLANEFTGFGDFFTDEDGHEQGKLFAKYFFQLSFATTATTIVSGAMAERANLKAYMFFSFVNFLSYVFPAHWIWSERGYFYKLGVVDVAGCGPVHLVGGTSALVASLMLKPRLGVFVNGKKNTPPMGNPTNVLLGTFMLWWGWLGFNCGSTFGVSGGKWKLATRAAVTTLNASTGAGMWGMTYSYFLAKKFKGKLDIGTLTSSLLGGLVSITAVCAICHPWEALIIGFIGGIITTYGMVLMDWLQIDDPVSAVSIHGFCGAWGMIVVGLIGEKDTLEGVSRYPGVLKGGPVSYLGYQTLAAVCIVAWAGSTAFLELLVAHCIFGLRVSPEHELLGADFCEHGILQPPSITTTHQGGDEEGGEDANKKISHHHRKTSRTVKEFFQEPDGSKTFTIDRQIYSKYTASPLHRGPQDNIGFDFVFPNKLDDIKIVNQQKEDIKNRGPTMGDLNKTFNNTNDQILNLEILDWSNGKNYNQNKRKKTSSDTSNKKNKNKIPRINNNNNNSDIKNMAVMQATSIDDNKRKKIK